MLSESSSPGQRHPGQAVETGVFDRRWTIKYRTDATENDSCFASESIYAASEKTAGTENVLLQWNQRRFASRFVACDRLSHWLLILLLVLYIPIISPTWPTTRPSP